MKPSALFAAVWSTSQAGGPQRSFRELVLLGQKVRGKLASIRALQRSWHLVSTCTAQRAAMAARDTE